MRRLIAILLLVLCLPPSAWGAKISQIDFEDNATDSYGWTTAFWDGIGAPSTIQYVSGRTGKALRSSHNDGDDGGGDFSVAFPSNPIPASGELYISYWVKYEEGYTGGCDNPTYATQWNIKLLWFDGPDGTGHLEIMLNNWTGNNRVSFLVQGGSGSTIPIGYCNSGSTSYTPGNWAHVEIYIKQSSGTNHTNADGIVRLKWDGTVCGETTSAVTGTFTGDGLDRSPSQKASCSPATGEAWWQIDDFEAWDSMPDEEPDSTPPSFSSAAIASSGNALTMTFNEAVTADSGDVPVISASGGAVTASYTSGSGLNALTFGLSRTIYNNETVTVSYTQDTDGIEDVAGNDLATLSSQSVSVANAPAWTSGGGGGPVSINSSPGAVQPHYNSGNRRIVRMGDTVIALCPESSTQDHTYRSTDDGATWSEIDTDGSYSGCLITGDNETVYHFYYTASSSVYMVKFKYDATPGAPVAIQGGIGTIQADKDIGATVDADGKLYVVYHHGSPDALYLITSSDEGVTWSAPSTIASGGNGYYYARPEVTSDGLLIITYCGWSDETIYFAKSSNGGQTWTTTQLASSHTANPDILPVDSDTFYVFAQTHVNPYGLVFRKTDDTGATWTDWAVIEATTSTVGYGDPSSALGSDGTVYVSYRNDSQTGSAAWREHVAASSDGGATWSVVYDYDEAAERVGTRSHLRYQTWWNYGGKLEWTWMQYVNSGANRPIYYDYNDDVFIQSLMGDEEAPAPPTLSNVTISNGSVQ